MAKGYNRGMSPSGGQAGMLSQIKKLQEQMEKAQEELKTETITVSAGGGAVKATITGDQLFTAFEIDPELLKDADAEMLQDLVLSAANLALEKSKEMAAERMGPLAGGLPGFGF
ncbi:MAG: YbaB/EbfC family nucleoid-associated protein [Anaerolineaceae bacterium]